ncbi:MAG: transglutaminase domain-containing protein [Deltaproteobacteria bacterium]|nr:transglutaminase domain-containing protein [Deltaproteobacteria bacterium]
MAPSLRSPRARAASRGALLLVLSIAVPALAQQGPVLHEWVPYDPTVESELGVVKTQGGFDVEKLTTSGKITAPDPGRPIDTKTPVYGAKADEKFVPDRDTRRVDRLPYDDPFRPRLAPFKRLVAFDLVDSDYSLRVADPKRVKVDVGVEALKGVAAYKAVDVFYADVAVDLNAGVPVRIPSAVGGNIIKRAHVSPPVAFKLERDGADNLFILAESSGKARLVMEIEAARDAFGGAELSEDWADLGHVTVPALPAAVQHAADEFVTKDLRIDKATSSPRDVVRALVRYFREFKESEDPPPNTGDIYLDLVRAKKGVCRHRAFGFLITALSMKIPTRFVHNEAHAWVEVGNGSLWYRIDLGGAGRLLDDKTEKPEKEQPAYSSPDDPYSWPAGATKGSDLLPPSSPSPGTGPTGGGTTSPTPPPSPPSSASGSAPSTAPPSKVTLAVPGAPSEDALELLRLREFVVKGRVVDASGAPCKSVRVDFKISSNTAGERVVGTLPTDADGNYEGKLAIPREANLGEYTLVAHTPGAGTCGQGSSE